jgi:two-component system, OmpR family, response regulator VicR
MKTILIVDDEFALVESLADLLQDAGYRVVSAANGKDGLARAEKEKPDLIVTDFMMPIADGMELIRSVRSSPESRNVPVVMMTATSKHVALPSQAKAGTHKVNAFLRKPFQVEELLDVIEGLIGKGDVKGRS